MYNMNRGKDDNKKSSFKIRAIPSSGNSESIKKKYSKNRV